MVTDARPTISVASYFSVDQVEDNSPSIRDVIKRSLGSSEGGISEYWRMNTSNLEAPELANSLRALRKVTGHLGENVGRIEWAGMSQDRKASIVLDPGLVLGKYPIPHHKFDYLVGLITHEALHKTEWTDFVWKKLSEAMKEMRIVHKVIFQKIVYLGEDIYVDKLSERSILGLYVRSARKVAMEFFRTSLKSSKTSVDELVYLWWMNVFGLDMTQHCGSEKLSVYQTSLDILNDLAQNLTAVSGSTKGVSQRCQERSDLYLEAWENLKDTIVSWKIIDKTLMWGAGSYLGDAKERKGKKKKTALSADVAKEIEADLAYDSTDITPIIHSVVKGRDEVIPTSRWDFNIPAHPVIDLRLVARLKAVFQDYADRKIVVSRGLTSGKIDKRRLYRAPISGRCFKDVQRLPIIDWDICLLIDASGSMRGPKWQMVENTLGTLYKAFSGFQNRLQAYGYFEVDGVCIVSNLIKDKILLSVPPFGHTVSGQAIIGAAYFMPRDGNRRFLIHVTDGESNLGCHVRFGIDYCQKETINLVTLGVGYKNRKIMENQYGKTLSFLDHFGQLPQALENLLKWAILYGHTHKSEPDNEIFDFTQKEG